jgi:NDP-sugar pyrophosphorylase family protein
MAPRGVYHRHTGDACPTPVAIDFTGEQTPMHAVILAAGDGGRLQPYTEQTPKPLLDVGGRPLIQHVLDALVAGGIDEVTIVVGYLSQAIREALGETRPDGLRIRFVENTAFESGNARSIWAAGQEVEGPFVLAMADHLIDPTIVVRLLAGRNGRPALAVEYVDVGDARADEATRAHVVRDRVVDLGKEIQRWNALDTGVFWCTPAVFGAMAPEMRDGEMGAVFAALARSGQLDAIDVTGCRWLDVDTPEDLRAAEAWVAAR